MCVWIFRSFRSSGAANPRLEHVEGEDLPVVIAADGAAQSTPAAPAPVVTAAPPTVDGEVRFLFDSEDMYETMVAIRNPNCKVEVEDRMMGQLKVSLSTSNMEELYQTFAELSPAMMQLGLDESSVYWGNRLCIVRHEEAEAMTSSSTSGMVCGSLEARRFLRRGAPPSLRGKLWRAALGLSDDVSPAEQRTFAQLRAECDRLDMITDDLFLHDVGNIIDDPKFFVFEVTVLYLISIYIYLSIFIYQYISIYVFHFVLTNLYLSG